MHLQNSCAVKIEVGPLLDWITNWHTSAYGAKTIVT